MRKITATILSVLALGVFATAEATVLFAQNSPVFTANAETAVESFTPNASLLSPIDYSQYLALEHPADVTVHEGNFGIADGTRIYVYDAALQSYFCYDGHSSKIAKLQFDSKGNLYFSDDNGAIYRLDLASLTAGAPIVERLDNVMCSTFLIHEDSLFYTTTVIQGTKISAYSLTDKTSVPLVQGLQTMNTPLAYGKNGLYYITESDEDRNLSVLYALDPITGNVLQVTTLSARISSMAIADNLFCFTTKNGDFYAYNHTEVYASTLLEDVAPVYVENNGFGAICSISGSAYTIYENTVKQFSVNEASFTGFEICSASASKHRLNGASELCLNDNRLFIADDGNTRISVYNVSTAEFSEPIPSTISSPYLASYGDTLLVSAASQAILYNVSASEYGETELSLDETKIQGNVVGVTSVYNRYYVLTDSNHCYTLQSENGVWTYTESKKDLNSCPTALTSDIYGALYVAYDNDSVYRFTESELLSTATGTKILDGLPASTKIAVDYETNLYALSGNALHKFTENEQGQYIKTEVFSADYALVNDPAPQLSSFAFGIEENAAYLLYAGNYLVQTDELQLPIVNPIPVGDAAKQIFGNDAGAFSLTTVRKDAILIEFDVNRLSTATEFPYVAFERCEAPKTALKIGEVDGYNLLIVAETDGYAAYLGRISDCEAIAETEYRVNYTENAFVGYLTNDVEVYKYPYMTKLLTLANAKRGETVRVVGEIGMLNYAYYEVVYTTEAGEVRGYIPKNYVMPFEGIPPTTQTLTLGETEANDDNVWRLAYIVLGTGAICILVDFLLLRRKKEEDD